MAHPTRTGDVVAFSYPPYQFDAATPGTLVALSAFFGQHGYVPDVQNLNANINMRASFFAGGRALAMVYLTTCASIDLAPTIAYPVEGAHAAAITGPGADRDSWLAAAN